MNSCHDPDQQINYLWQSLASDKKPIGLFLSAGCPFSIKDSKGNSLIPDINGLTKAVCSKLGVDKKLKPFLDKVCSNVASDGKDQGNIEDILTHIRAIKDVAGTDTVRGLKRSNLVDLDSRICDIIVEVMNVSLPENRTAYHQLASWMGSVNRPEPVELFTTNYDLLFEQSLEEASVPFFDGFVGARLPFFDLQAIEDDALPSRWARLWKLHGSINWRLDKKLLVTRSDPGADGGQRVIHPSHLKYDESRRMPYLAMIDRLGAFIKKPSALLVICGYSFRDEHLNAAIIQGLQGNPTASAFGLLYGTIDKYPEAMTLAQGRSNLSILGEDKATIGTVLAPWREKPPPKTSDALYGIEWIPRDEKKADGPHHAKCLLGDFTKLGGLLEGLVGPTAVKGEDEETE